MKMEQMGTLEGAKPIIIICTRDRDRATAFYRDTLGLTLAYEDHFAAVFNIGGVTLRVSFVADFTPHEHTILGFHVLDVAAAVKALRGKGRDLQYLSKLQSRRPRHIDFAGRNPARVLV
jgi:catechol 2,3-dioxygenase-like lactoylglutathione lyase family enzyme